MIITAEQFRSLSARKFSEVTEDQIQALARGESVAAVRKKRSFGQAHAVILEPYGRLDCLTGQPGQASDGTQARGRADYEPGRMNKTETRYFNHLELLQKAGEVIEVRFEAFKLRLAGKTFYTPDFDVMLAGGLLEFHEVKGHMEDDAAVKLKVAAEMFPRYRFRLVRWLKGEWVITDVP